MNASNASSALANGTSHPQKPPGEVPIALRQASEQLELLHLAISEIADATGCALRTEAPSQRQDDVRPAMASSLGGALADVVFGIAKATTRLRAITERLEL